MKVNTKYYNLLKSGKKVIELRLYDAKRQQIKINDKINFSNSSNVNDNFNAKVINLYKAKNFEELCKKIKPQSAGFRTKTELIKTMEEFYSKTYQQKYGVLGIEIIIDK